MKKLEKFSVFRKKTKKKIENTESFSEKYTVGTYIVFSLDKLLLLGVVSFSIGYDEFVNITLLYSNKKNKIEDRFAIPFKIDMISENILYSSKSNIDAKEKFDIINDEGWPYKSWDMLQDIKNFNL